MERPERMRAVSQQLLSRTVLERTARLEHLDQNGSIESAISRIRSSVSVSLPDSITPTGADGAARKSLSPDQKAQLDTYQVSVIDSSPDDAQRIVNRLAQVFVEENSRSREVRAQDTSQFIESQLQASGTRLAALEARLRDDEGIVHGPAAGADQRQPGDGLGDAAPARVERDDDARRAGPPVDDRAPDRRDAAERRQRGALPPQGTPGESGSARVQSLRRELADAQLTYTDKHPEVVRLKDELATAEKAAAAERTRPAADRIAILNATPEYRQLQKDREIAKMRISELQRQQAAITAQIAQYQGRVEGAPRVEQQMVSLQREYDLERGTYQDLSGKKQTALLDEELQRKQGGEQFAVLVPAGLPVRAVQAEADARDADGDCRGPRPRRRACVRPRVPGPLGARRPRSA